MARVDRGGLGPDAKKHTKIVKGWWGGVRGGMTMIIDLMWYFIMASQVTMPVNLDNLKLLSLSVSPVGDTVSSAPPVS